MTTHLLKKLSADVSTAWCQNGPAPLEWDVVVEAALSDCEDCLRARTEALNQMRPKSMEGQAVKALKELKELVEEARGRLALRLLKELVGRGLHHEMMDGGQTHAWVARVLELLAEETPGAVPP